MITDQFEDVFRYEAWEDQPRDDSGRWTASWTTRDTIKEARKKLTKRELRVQSGNATSAASGRPIKRWVDIGDGTKIHPDELHRTKFGEDDEPYISTDESLDVIDGSGSKAERSFVTAIKRAGLNKGLTTIAGPHGYSATLPGAEWKKIDAQGQSFAEWLDDQDPAEMHRHREGDQKTLTTIGGERESDDFFAPKSAGQARLFAKESGRWITIGGQKSGDGKRHGGSPVYVENGRITKGNPGLTGKKIAALGERAEGVSVRTANKREVEHARASWAKKARSEGIEPAALHQLAGEIKAHHDAYGDDIRALRTDVAKNYPSLRSVALSANRGGDSAGVKDLDRISQRYAQSGRYNHLFGGHDTGAFREGQTGAVEDFSEKLYEYLVDAPLEPIPESDAYEQAFDHIKGSQALDEKEAVPFTRAAGDMFAYAEPLAPRPTTASRTKPPRVGTGMGAVKPALGLPAKLPSPFPPDTKVMSEPHPEGVARPVVPKALRAGNPETLQQRIPRPSKPRYKLQVPMEEAYSHAHEEIMGEMNKVTHPEDKERYREEIEDLEKVFVSGSERLMTRFLEDHVGWKTFGHLVQSLKDQEPAVTSRPGLYARTENDIFQGNAMNEKPIKTEKETPKPADAKPARPRPFNFPRPRGHSSIPGILLDIAAREKAGKAILQ